MNDAGGVRSAVARVIGPGGAPVGGAFLVAPGVALTAAHVVSLANGASADTTDRPIGAVLLNFAAAPELFLRAELVHWVPPGGASPEDIAGLRLIDPVPGAVVPAPLTELRAPLGRRVVTLGFPRDAPHGGWGLGRLAGQDARALIQVDTLPESQFTFEEGFSGTPVWDVEDAAVAGLVVEGWTRGRCSGFMIPTPVLLESWPWLAERVRPASPFRGLKSFAEDDTAVFFGRDELIERIVTVTANAPALTVVGPSGVGKSSLLNAGVLSRLRRREGLVVATMRPSQAQTPLRSVALAMFNAAEPGVDPLTRGRGVDDFAERLGRGLIAEVVGDVLDRRRGERLMLVIDQLEEIFVAAPDELAQVATALMHCLRPGSRLDLLAAMRADLLGRALQHADLAELVRDTRLVTVGELSQAELRSVIVEPVRRTRMVRYEAGLVDRLLADVGLAPGRLPLLQFTLAMLWDEQESGVLTHRAYDALGGIDSALARHAESVWEGLGGAQRKAAGRLLVQLLYPLAGSASFVRRVAPRAELDDGQWDAAQRLAADRARLVVVRERDTGQAAELAHDALVTHWRRLAELGERDREFREWQEVLRQRIRQWERRLRSADRLLTGADLRDALRWQAHRGDDFAPAERTYVEAGRRQRTTRWRKWTLRVGAAVIVAGLVLWNWRLNVASDAADTMIRNASATDPYAKLRTVLRAYQTRANQKSEMEIGLAYGRYARIDQLIPDYTARPLPPVVEGGKPLQVEPPAAILQKVSADGRTVVTTDPKNNVTLWQVDGDRVTGRALGQIAERVTISRDGRYVAYLQSNLGPNPLNGTKSSCGAPPLSDCVYLYDTVTGQSRELGVLKPYMFAQIPILRFDPTGQVVAVLFGSDLNQQKLRTWELATGRQRDDVTVPGEVNVGYDMWLAPGAHSMLFTAAVARRPGSRVFENKLMSMNLTGPDPAITALTEDFAHDQFAASGDGSKVAGLVPTHPPDIEQQKLVVWDVVSGRRVAETPELSEAQSGGNIALDLHGDRAFVTAWLAGAVSIWRVGETTAQPITLKTHGWDDVLPLGSGEDGPLLLVRENVVGLVLPAPGKPTPMQRWSVPPPYEAGKTPSDGRHPDQWYDEMCSMLASDILTDNETTDLPAGAHTGQLCH